MRARLLINPASGGGRARDALPAINARLRSRVNPLDIVMTTGDGDAAAAAARAAEEGCDLLFVAGGDGTLNEALRGLQAADAIGRVTIGIVPMGTGNDFARALGIPEDLDGALDALLALETRRIDLGELNGLPFINQSAGGFVAEVSEAVSPELKSVAGKLAYLIGGARVLLTHDPVTVRVTIEEGEPGPSDLPPLLLQLFAVSNAPYIGGGHLVAPGARIDDGLLEVCLVEAMPVLELIRVLALISAGDHLDDPRVHAFRASRFSLAFDRPQLVNTDGQVLEATECRYTVRPRALAVLAPPAETRGED